MSSFLKPRVKETTTTTGTGTMQLLGAVSGYTTFLASFGNGNLCFYFVVDGANWEYGLGTINSSSQLARTQIFNSSNSGAAITLAAGTKNVYCFLPPECCINNGQTTFTSGTTPSVYDQHVLILTYSGGTTITDFVNERDGQELVLIFTNSNCTIQHNANIRLSGGANFGGTANDTMRLVSASGIWYECSRSVNT